MLVLYLIYWFFHSTKLDTCSVLDTEDKIIYTTIGTFFFFGSIFEDAEFSIQQFAVQGSNCIVCQYCQLSLLSLFQLYIL